MDLVSACVFLLSFHLLLLQADSYTCPESFLCGSFDMEFPLTNNTNPGCGLITVHGCDTPGPKTIFTDRYTILEEVSKNKFVVQDNQLLDYFRSKDSCLLFRNLTTRPPPLSFTYSPNRTLFYCFNQTSQDDVQNHFENYRRINANFGRSSCISGAITLYYSDDIPEMEESFIPTACSMIQLPLRRLGDSDDLFSWSTPNFTLEWSVLLGCVRSGSGNEYVCDEESSRVKKIIFIGGMTITALASILIIIFLFTRRKRAKAKQKYEKDIILFLINNGYPAPLRYKYSSVKKMTNSFGENLGKGGYGSVYKGQLPDGHPVAVKILNESNENGKDFINEVASISRTSHVNIVALLGYCFEGPKRALIYDYMPNGSLEKFIGHTASGAAEIGLGWDKLLDIAVGIARGLEYLHQGCNTRILHLDIKPQNILLDKDLNPKISDFGLAKLCPNRSSIVSMMVARGTIGYIAPEVFSRNFGEVSYKSDVYSYGMLVLEMVGGRKSIDRGDVDHTSEMYFPHYIHRQLEMDAERDDYVSTMDENQVAMRNLMIIGLWCIQTNPKDRPSMTKVVEMLEGKLGKLEVPPRPYFNSPPRSAPTISSTSQSL